MFKHDKKLKPILFDIPTPSLKEINLEKETQTKRIKANQFADENNESSNNVMKSKLTSDKDEDEISQNLLH